LTQGFGNRDIAEQLGLREATVKTYLHEVYETLGVRSRTAALAELRRTLYAE
jgi:DNA-binding NarL/FixJ family response regulator